MSELQRLDPVGTATVADLAAKINAEHRACEAAAVSAVEHAVRAGELLAEVKQGLKHGGWLKWLEANFEGSARHAQRYMKLASQKHRLNATRVSHSSINGALRELQAVEAKEKSAEKHAARVEQVSKPEAYNGNRNRCWLPLETFWSSPKSWLLSESGKPHEYTQKKLREAIEKFTSVQEWPEEVLAVEGAEEELAAWRQANERTRRILLDAVEEAESELVVASMGILEVAKHAPIEKFPPAGGDPRGRARNPAIYREQKEKALRINEAQKKAWYARHPDGVCRCSGPRHWTAWGNNL